MSRWIMGIGALLCGTAVALGALGAHSLRGESQYIQEIWEKGVRYGFHHALALLVLGALLELLPGTPRFRKTLTAGVVVMIFAVLLFSGSLFALALTGNPFFVKTTPVGGVSFLIAWALVFFSMIFHRKGG